MFDMTTINEATDDAPVSDVSAADKKKQRKREKDARRRALEKKYGHLYVKGSKSKRCYCCSIPATTDDHIPPLETVDAVGVDALRAQGVKFILLPACLDCNCAILQNLPTGCPDERRAAVALRLRHWLNTKSAAYIKKKNIRYRLRKIEQKIPIPAAVMARAQINADKLLAKQAALGSISGNNVPLEHLRAINKKGSKKGAAAQPIETRIQNGNLSFINKSGAHGQGTAVLSNIGKDAVANGTGIHKPQTAEQRRQRSADASKALHNNPVLKFNVLAPQYGEERAETKCREKFGDVFTQDVHEAALTYHRAYKVATGAKATRKRIGWDAVLTHNPQMVLAWCFNMAAIKQSAAVRTLLEEQGNERQKAMVAEYRAQTSAASRAYQNRQKAQQQQD